MEVMYGGLSGRPIGDGLDGHSWWPAFVNIPTEYLETYYPLRVEYYQTGKDSGGAGLHRGGNCNEKLYTFLSSGTVSIHDIRNSRGELKSFDYGNRDEIVANRRI
jgi:N-methylhydantoinase B